MSSCQNNRSERRSKVLLLAAPTCSWRAVLDELGPAGQLGFLLVVLPEHPLQVFPWLGLPVTRLQLRRPPSGPCPTKGGRPCSGPEGTRHHPGVPEVFSFTEHCCGLEQPPVTWDWEQGPPYFLG